MRTNAHVGQHGYGAGHGAAIPLDNCCAPNQGKISHTVRLRKKTKSNVHIGVRIIAYGNKRGVYLLGKHGKGHINILPYSTKMVWFDDERNGKQNRLHLSKTETTGSGDSEQTTERDKGRSRGRGCIDKII